MTYRLVTKGFIKYEICNSEIQFKNISSQFQNIPYLVDERSQDDCTGALAHE